MLPYTYLLKVVLASAVFFSYYYLVLRNKTYHQYNRFYLLLAVVISWSIPLVPFDILIQSKQIAQPIYNAIEFFNPIMVDYLPIENYVEPEKIITKEDIIKYTILIIALFFVAKIVYELCIILKLKRKYNKQSVQQYNLYITQEKNTPFSFFNNIFWNSNIDINTPIGLQILEHELVHIKEKHSHDKLFMQINLVVGWFNPIFWIINKELSMIHEFIADKKSVPNANTELFAQMLLNTAFAGNYNTLTNPFFLSPIKRRLTMLTKKSLPKFSYAQRIMAFPILAIVIGLCSLKAQGYSVKNVVANVVNNVANKNIIDVNDNEQENNAQQIVLTKKYTVIIDAGHGGYDNGAEASDGTTEKEIALQLAQAIKQNNINENIEIVLTRNNDEFSDPRKRVEFSTLQNADLFISLHCNTITTISETKYNGVELFVVSKEKDNGYRQKSIEIANFINKNLAHNFNSYGIKERKVGIWVLQGTQCPAVLIETGFLNNAEDLKRLKDTKSQQLMSKDILKGITEFFYKAENGNSILQDAKVENVQETNDKYEIAEGKIASEIEINEYKNFVSSITTNSKSILERYNHSKLSKQQKDKMYDIFCKMNKTQREIFPIQFMKPTQPPSAIKPSESDLQKWASNKQYGIWIDNKKIDNKMLNQYKPKDFSNFNVSKLYGAALKIANGRTVQVDLMTNAYYSNWVKESKKEKYLIYINPKAVKTNNNVYNINPRKVIYQSPPYDSLKLWLSNQKFFFLDNDIAYIENIEEIKSFKIAAYAVNEIQNKYLFPEKKLYILQCFTKNNLKENVKIYESKESIALNYDRFIQIY